MQDRSWTDLVDAIAQNGTLVSNLVAAHVADNAGRCPMCTVAGTARHAAWPCTIARLAKDARAARARAGWPR